MKTYSEPLICEQMWNRNNHLRGYAYNLAYKAIVLLDQKVKYPSPVSLLLDAVFNEQNSGPELSFGFDRTWLSLCITQDYVGRIVW